MSNSVMFAIRRVFPIALVLTLAVLLTAACAGEDEGGTDGLPDGLADSTPTTTLPTTTLPTTTAPTTTVPTTTVPTTTAPSPTLGTDASPTVDTGGDGTAVTLEDVHTHVERSMPEVTVGDITAVDHADGQLTVETAWDSTMEADAQSLCDELLMMTTDPSLDSVTINGSDGSSLAECEAGG